MALTETFDEADPNARFVLVISGGGQNNRPTPRSPPENRNNASMNDLVSTHLSHALQYFGEPRYTSWTVSATEFTESVVPLNPGMTVRDLCTGRVKQVRMQGDDRFECKVYLHWVRSSVTSLNPAAIGVAGQAAQAGNARPPWHRNSPAHDAQSRPKEPEITDVSVRMTGWGHEKWFQSLTKSSLASPCLSQFLSDIGMPQQYYHTLGALPLHRDFQPSLQGLDLGRLMQSEQCPATWYQRHGEPWGSVTLRIFVHADNVGGVAPAAAP